MFYPLKKIPSFVCGFAISLCSFTRYVIIALLQQYNIVNVTFGACKTLGWSRGNVVGPESRELLGYRAAQNESPQFGLQVYT